MAAMNRSPVKESSRARETFILHSMYDGDERPSLPGAEKLMPAGSDEPTAGVLARSGVKLGQETALASGPGPDNHGGKPPAAAKDPSIAASADAYSKIVIAATPSSCFAARLPAQTASS